MSGGDRERDASVRASMVARLCRVHAPRHLLLAGTQDEALCRSLADAAMAHGATLHVATEHPPAWLADARAHAGDRCIVHHARPVDVIGVIPLADLAWIDGDANWFTVHSLLQALLARAEHLGRPFPLTLVAGAGWPSARRDSYADPGAIPEAHRHAHERAGVTPGRPAPGSDGLFADRFNAVAENEPGTGVLTAVEDFLAGRADQLRLSLLPGFGGLAALCSRSGAFSDAFAPAGLAQDLCVLADALEAARLDQAVQLTGSQHALQRAEALIGKLQSASPAPTPAPAVGGHPAPSTARASAGGLAGLLPGAIADNPRLRAAAARIAARLPGLARAERPADDGPKQEEIAALQASPIFDAAWYLSTYGDVADAEADPALHYLRDGTAELRDPGPYFSTAYYLSAYPDVAAEKLNPLLHYLANGAAERRNPGQHFATGEYLDAHPEVAASGLNPLQHYVTIGRAAGWQAPPVPS